MASLSKKVCSFEGCSRHALSKGMCDRHYRRWKKHGSPKIVRLRVRGVCSLEGCEDPHFGWGYCQRHYERYKRYGRFEKRPTYQVCTFEGCGQKHAARGYCTSHYRQWREGGVLKPLLQRPTATECVVEGCGEKPFRNGYCMKHNSRRKRGQDLTAASVYDKSPEERFWAKVKKSEGDKCWEWQGFLSRGGKSSGYGVFGFEGKMHRAHRIAYRFAFGEFAEHLFVLHRCDNPRCVRPDHLFLGTHTDNMCDMVNKGRASSGPGTQNPSAKLNEQQVLEIRALKGKLPRQDIADKYGVSLSAIKRIFAGKAWTHV